MTVVTDTSVVLNLCCIGHHDLLARIFGTVLAPPAVAGEFAKLAQTDPRFAGLEFPAFIKIAAPLGIAPILMQNQKIHPGEIEALSLAAEVKAAAILMDESAGRSIAAEMGLSCIGIIGILIQSKRDGLIGEIEPLLDSLRSKAGFWLAESLRTRILHMVGE